MALKDARKRLPEDHREVIWLRHHEHRSFEKSPPGWGAPRRQRKLWLRGPEQLEQELKPSP
jgi:hypothetical protein